MAEKNKQKWENDMRFDAHRLEKILNVKIPKIYYNRLIAFEK